MQKRLDVYRGRLSAAEIAKGMTVAGRNARRLANDGAKLLAAGRRYWRSEEHTSELQSLMRISYAVFCLKKKKKQCNYITIKYDIKRVKKDESRMNRHEMIRGLDTT